MFAAKRLGKELQKLQQNIPPGIEIVKAEDFREWQMDIRVLDSNPLYQHQIYRLVFIFPDKYPIEPPECTFLYVSPSSDPPPPSTLSRPIDLTADDNSQPTTTSTPPTSTHRPIPIHPHIYSNGIICLDLLGTAGWSPVQSVESVCMSIQSMLTGNSKNERPQGDKEFCQSMGPRGKYGWSGRDGRSGSGWVRGGRGLKDVRFSYDDDTV